MLTVCTFKWSDPGYRWNHLFTYGPEHVNRLYRGVQRHLSPPHRFVCITDDPEGIDPEVEVVPLWDDLRWMGGCYTRLRAFAPDMAEVLGPRFVWVDLDCVVVGNLDHIMARPEPFVIWRNGVSSAPYCGSMVMMDAGARAQVWETFDPETSPEAASRFVGTDQAWIAHCLGPDEAVWTNREGVYSRADTPKASAMPGLTRRRYGCDPGTLPKDARIVFWHGPFDPSMPEVQDEYPWVRDHWQ